MVTSEHLCAYLVPVTLCGSYLMWQLSQNIKCCVRSERHTCIISYIISVIETSPYGVFELHIASQKEDHGDEEEEEGNSYLNKFTVSSCHFFT